MKKNLIAVAITIATITTSVFAADVGVSVSVGQPGFFGRIDIGDFPQPQVIYAKPVVIERGIPDSRPPVYLRVPPSHARNWSRHCHEYNACGERVMFVQDKWYKREYIPRYQERQRNRGNDHRGNPGNNHRDDHHEDHNNDRHNDQRRDH